MNRPDDKNRTDMEATQRPAATHSDIIVCGAGLAGLAAAATAAGEGASVLLVDPQSPGGRARTNVSDGFSFNSGPHALYRQGAAQRVLTDLGVPIDGAPVPVSGAGAMCDGDITPLPVWPAGLLRSRALRLRSKPGFAMLMTRATKVDPASLAELSIRDWCNSEGLSDDARRVVEAIARLSTYADRPEEQSAEALFVQLGLGGVLYLNGGWQTLVDGLQQVALGRGVSLNRARPESVRPAASAGRGGWTVAFADGSEATSAAVILACGGPEAMGKLAELPHSWLDRAGPPVRAACLDVGLIGEPQRRFVLGLDEPMYMSRHDPPAQLAPEGHSLVSLAEYLSQDADRDREEARGRLEDFAKRCGIRTERIAKTRYLHDMVVAHGTPLAANSGLAGRPPVEVPGLEGLFAAGDWIGSDGLLADAALASGKKAGMLATRATSTQPA